MRFAETVRTLSVALAIVLVASGLSRWLGTIARFVGREWLVLLLALGGASVAVFGTLSAYYWWTAPRSR